MPYVDEVIFDSDEQQEKFPSYDDQSPYDEAIGAASERYGVDPFWARATAKAESNFNVAAISSAGAQGLFQLMEGTAKDLGVKNRLDPNQNINGGVQYLGQMIDIFDGDKIKGSAAFNAGARNVKKAVQLYGDDWLENLHKVTGKNKKTGKFHADETRNYLKKIQKFYDEYNPQQGEQIKRGIIAKENLIIDEGAPLAGTYVAEDKM